jgi:hypothetical protein
MAFLDQVPWWLVLFFCATLGLAPFTPPHVVEKLGMLARGELVRVVDWGDLVLHAAPWLLLLAKAVRSVST